MNLLNSSSNTQKTLIGGLVVFIILVVVRSSTEMNPFDSARYLAIVGLFISVYRWWSQNKSTAISSLRKALGSLILDSSLNKEINSTAVPFVYSILHGIFVGGSVGFFVDWMHNVLNRNSYLPSNLFIALAIGSLVYLLLVRITFEYIYKK